MGKKESKHDVGTKINCKIRERKREENNSNETKNARKFQKNYSG